MKYLICGVLFMQGIPAHSRGLELDVILGSSQPIQSFYVYPATTCIYMFGKEMEVSFMSQEWL